jgi:serine protease Do
MNALQSRKPMDSVNIELQRDKEKPKVVEVILARRGEFPRAMMRSEDPRSAMSGRLSNNRTGFPNALQHDLNLKPDQCGGPLLNLDGEVVGVNIARSGRIESMAIPTETLLQLLETVSEGHFNIPEVDELRGSIAKMNAEKSRVDAEKAKILAMEEKLSKGITEAQKRIDALLGNVPPAPAPAQQSSASEKK